MNNLPLSSICDYEDSSININNLSLEFYVTTDSMLPDKKGIVRANNLPPSLKCKNFEKENILISNIRPYFKKIWFATFEGGCSSDVLVLKCTNEKFDEKYVYYNLFQDIFFKHMMNGSKGSKMPRGDKDHIMTFQIPEFPKFYQKKISNFLSKIDEKFSLNNKINEELESMIKMLFNYWFVQFDFPDEQGRPYKESEGDMEYNDLSKRKIPKGWTVKTLGEIATHITESIDPQQKKDTRFKHYNIPSYDKTGFYSIEPGSDIKSNKFIVKKNDILVSKLNPQFKRIVYPVDESDLVCSTEFVVLRSPTIPIKNYIYSVVRDELFTSYCIKNATGTSNSHKRVDPVDIFNFHIAYNLKYIEKFGSRIEPLLQLINKNKVQNQELIEQREFLLPLLMNGQVKIK